jgi:hypothetical protein
MDLVTRLREAMSPMADEAADEIERLLSENDKLCKSVIFWRGKADEPAAALSSHKGADHKRT